ncbi:MAG: class III signal peptide-containing protein [Planctomycetota bacterium]
MRKLHLRKNRRGQGLVEYIIIVAAVAMISLAAVSMFGHKVADQYAVGAGMLPGAHSDDNIPIATGFFAGLTGDTSTGLTGNGAVSWGNITGSTSTVSLVNNVIANGENGGDAFVAE